MARWSIRQQWVVECGEDWCVFIDADGRQEGRVLETINLMLANGRWRVRVLSGEEVPLAPDAAVPEALAVTESEPYWHKLEVVSGDHVSRGYLPKLFEQVKPSLEASGDATFLTDWSEDSDSDERRILTVATPGKRSRPSALAGRL